MKLPPIEPRDRERFLAAVAEQVPLDRVVELYLFQPIRQGGVESGVAVIAAAADAPPVPADEAVQTEAVDPEAQTSDAATDSRVSRAASSGDVATDAPPAAASGDAGDPTMTGDAPPADVADPDRPEPRYTVYTARYRHVLKGPERGRWEVSVVAEAEAPLAAVGAVVRGVQHRAGDVEPPEYMTGDALRDALGRQVATEG